MFSFISPNGYNGYPAVPVLPVREIRRAARPTFARAVPTVPILTSAFCLAFATFWAMPGGRFDTAYLDVVVENALCLVPAYRHHLVAVEHLAQVYG